jgi:hypothetical protein
MVAVAPDGERAFGADEAEWEMGLVLSFMSMTRRMARRF